MLKTLYSNNFLRVINKQSGFFSLLVLLVGLCILTNPKPSLSQSPAEAKLAYEKILRGDSLTLEDKLLIESYLPVPKGLSPEYSEMPLLDNGGTFFVYSWPTLRIPPSGTGGGGGDSTVVVFNVAGLNGVISDVQVTLDTVRHSWDSDLIISLESPSGTQITLINRRGGSSDNFTRTLLTDSALVNIASGNGPFNGNFRPEQPLSLFDGEIPNGSWRLKFIDAAPGDTGSVRRCRLQILAPVGLGLNDFSCQTIFSPSQSFFLPASVVSVSARFVNLGTMAQASPVKYRFNGGASVTENTNVLSPFTFEDHNFSIPLALPLNSGVYSQQVFSALATDTNRSNDTCSTTITVRTCEDLSLEAPGVINGNTCGAGNDCGLRTSEDQIIRVHIPFEAEWTFSLCGSVFWDSYAYLSLGCCDTIIDFDDDGCGNVFGPSIISCLFLPAGYYNLIVEGWLANDCGDFELSVSPCGNPCSAPEQLVIAKLGDDAKLSWRTSPFAQSYIVSAASNLNDSFLPIATVFAPDTTFLDTDPFETTPRFYQVMAQCP